MSLTTAGSATYEDSEILQTKKKNDALTEEDLGKVSGGLSIARGKTKSQRSGSRLLAQGEMLTPSARGSAGLYGRAARPPAIAGCAPVPHPVARALAVNRAPRIASELHTAPLGSRKNRLRARRDHPGLTRHTLVLGSLTSGLLCLSKPTL
jgi:hypothetical protein